MILNAAKNSRVKGIIIVLFFLAVLIAAALTRLKPFIKFKAAEQLSKSFPGSEIAIKDCRFSSWHSIVLTGISVTRKGIYDFKIGQVSAEYDLISLAAKRIARVGLNDAIFNISIPKNQLADFAQYIHSGSSEGGGMAVDAFTLKNIDINVTAKDLKLNSSLSIDYSLVDGQLIAVNLSIPFLESRGINIQNVFIES